MGKFFAMQSGNRRRWKHYVHECLLMIKILRSYTLCSCENRLSSATSSNSINYVSLCVNLHLKGIKIQYQITSENQASYRIVWDLQIIYSWICQLRLVYEILYHLTHNFTVTSETLRSIHLKRISIHTSRWRVVLLLAIWLLNLSHLPLRSYPLVK